MTRRRHALLGLLVLGAAAACSCGAEPPKPEHVVLIVIDTLRADRTTPYGHSRDTSPTLARLAREGVLFENAVAQSSWTSPSMVSLMTGKYLAGERLTIPDEAPTLAESFQSAGYETAAFICNDILSEKTKFSRGFAVFEQLEPYSDDARIVQWLESAKGKRTFTWIHLNEPHDVQTAAGPHYGPPAESGAQVATQAPDLASEHRAFLEGFARERSLANAESDIEHIRAERSGYDDDVAFSDKRVANYVGALERAGIYGSTAIVIAADHGEGLWTREAFDTGWRHEQLSKAKAAPSLVNLLMPTHGNQANHELVHVPLILRAPGLPSGTIVKSGVENVDIAPTLLELCDLPAAGALHGKSLVPLARAPGSDPARKVFSMTRYVSTVIDERRMQLLLPTPKGECELGLVPELYDLRADPWARENLAQARPEVVRELTAVIEARLAIGLAGEDVRPDDETLALLQQVGYADGDGRGVVEVKPDLSRVPTETLIASVANAKLPCTVRLEAAEALVGRELGDADRTRLGELAARADAVAVKRALERALGR